MERELRFFLADPEAERPRLLPEDERHAGGVLRLGAGDRLVGLDGAGGRHPLAVASAVRGRLELVRDGAILREPEPGRPGSALPWIEVAAPLPKGARAEAMLDRLTQLGLCSFRPLLCARNQGFPREAAEQRMASLERACREACKQSGRAFLPRIHPSARPADLRAALGEGRAALLAPRAAATLAAWAVTLEAGPVAVIAGPEGGFDDEEARALDFAAAVALGPHVLRIETAVEAAVATLAQAFYARSVRPA